MDILLAKVIEKIRYRYTCHYRETVHASGHSAPGQGPNENLEAYCGAILENVSQIPCTGTQFTEGLVPETPLQYIGGSSTDNPYNIDATELRCILAKDLDHRIQLLI